MQPILIDRGQLVAERLVEQLDDLCVTLHVGPPVARGLTPACASGEAQKRLKSRKSLRLKVTRRCDLGGARVGVEQLRALGGDQVLGKVAARPALELAAERAIGAVGARATAPGGGPDLILANRVAATQDHAEHITLMRHVRNWNSTSGLGQRRVGAHQLGEEALVRGAEVGEEISRRLNLCHSSHRQISASANGADDGARSRSRAFSLERTDAAIARRRDGHEIAALVFAEQRSTPSIAATATSRRRCRRRAPFRRPRPSTPPSETSWTAVTSPLGDQIADEFAARRSCVKIDRRRRPSLRPWRLRASQMDWPKWPVASTTDQDRSSRPRP